MENPNEILPRLKGRVLLVDADIIAFEMASLTEEKVDFGAGEIAIGDPYDAAKSAIAKCKAMRENLWCDTMLLCFTGKDNFRYEVLPSYKGNRDPSKKPEMLDQVKEIMEEMYPLTLRVAHLEADDVMGIIQTHPDFKDRTTIATLDKDLKQISGEHYNWRTKELFTTAWPSTELFFFYQLLRGDTADGYKGCPQMGDKKIRKWMSMIGMKCFKLMPKSLLVEKCFAFAYSCYLNKKLGIADLLAQARVARMLRWGEVDPETWEPILWQPPKPKPNKEGEYLIHESNRKQ